MMRLLRSNFLVQGLALLALSFPLWAGAVEISEEGKAQLLQDEGLTRLTTFLTTQAGGREGVRTLGYGYNVDAAADPRGDLILSGVPEEEVEGMLSGEVPISNDQADKLFHLSLERAEEDAEYAIPNIEELPQGVQDALINMAFQLGAGGLSDFEKMKAALQEGDFRKAAEEVLDSKLAREQASERAMRVAQNILEHHQEGEILSDPVFYPDYPIQEVSTVAVSFDSGKEEIPSSTENLFDIRRQEETV